MKLNWKGSKNYLSAGQTLFAAFWNFSEENSLSTTGYCSILNKYLAKLETLEIIFSYGSLIASGPPVMTKCLPTSTLYAKMQFSPLESATYTKCSHSPLGNIGWASPICSCNKFETPDFATVDSNPSLSDPINLRSSLSSLPTSGSIRSSWKITVWFSKCCGMWARCYPTTNFFQRRVMQKTRILLHIGISFAGLY